MFRVIPIVALAAVAACTQAPPPIAIAPPAPTPAPAPLAFTWTPPCMPPAKTGEEIVMVQSAANSLSKVLESEPGYGGAWYSHGPCYRFIVAFTDGLPRKSVVDAADPKLRPYLFFSKTRFTVAEREAGRIEMMRALGGAGIEHAFFGWQPQPETYVIHVASETDLARARLLIPERYRPFGQVLVGQVRPTPGRG